MALKKKVGISMESSGVVARLNRFGDTVEKHSVDVMRRYGDQVHKLAKLNVPVQDFHVEDSIVKEESRTGLNRRIEIKVGVDPSILRELSGIDYDYSVWLHEGTYNLGELSILKDAISKSEDPRASVGPKYLEKAIDSVKDDALRDMRSAIRGAFR